MRHIYIITILVAVIGIISTILVLTTMQTQSLISEMKSFKENIIEVNNMLKEENEQLRYQIRWLSAMMKLDSSPTIENPISNNLSEIPMVTIVKGRISGVTEEKNLVIRNNDEFTQLNNISFDPGKIRGLLGSHQAGKSGVSPHGVA